MNRTPEILADLLAEIEGAEPSELPAIIGQVEAVKAQAFARLVAPAAPAKDRLLTAEEVAAVLGDGCTSRWVLDHQSELGRVKLPGRHVRFSEQRIQQFIKRRSKAVG